MRKERISMKEDVEISVNENQYKIGRHENTYEIEVEISMNEIWYDIGSHEI